jgi:flagellar biosynthesis/type III secretory pathway M-ring protein FliF/YscJ
MEENLTLRDIRSLEPIDDISLYLFIIAIVFVSLIIGALLYKLFSTMRARKKENLRKEVLQRLKDIEFDDPKDAAYKITKYARFLATDERSQRMLEQLLPKLEKYKFIKDVPEFDDESVNYYNLFLKSVDE